MRGRIFRAGRVLALAVGVAGWSAGISSCALDPPFELHVTFAGPLEIEPGAEVRYQGVPIGDVDDVSLQQAAPNEPARVVLSLSIHDDAVTLREGDLFEVTSDGLMGDPYVRVTAGRESSAPLVSGATIAGRAPFLTRFLESADESLGALGELAREEWLEAMREAARDVELEDDAVGERVPEEPPRQEAPAPGTAR